MSGHRQYNQREREGEVAPKKEKKEKKRREGGIEKNYGFDDTQRFNTCTNCRRLQPDVYPFQLIGEEYYSRISGSGFKIDLCEGCLQKMSDRGINLKALQALPGDCLENEYLDPGTIDGLRRRIRS